EFANASGWRTPIWPKLTPEVFPSHHSIMLRNHSGGVIDLHHLALFICRNEGDDDSLWKRARAVTFRGIEVLAPSPADEVVITVAHGLLHGPIPTADWVLDVEPIIRSGEVDWAVIEHETASRDVDVNVASGLLLLSERLNRAIPAAMLDRMIARAQEPFITDFEHFAKAYHPSDPWVVDRVRAAASLRALKSCSRSGEPLAMVG